MVPSQCLKRVNYILNCLLFDSKPMRFYKTENPIYFRRTTPRRFYFYKIGSHVPTAALYNPDTVYYLTDLPCWKLCQHAPIMLVRVYNANALPTSNLRKNLRSDLRNNLRNNLDLRIAPLISSNSHPFLYIHLTSFRRFSVEGEDSYSPQGSYKGGYQRDPDRKFLWREPWREWYRGGAVGMVRSRRQFIKKELPVSAAAINLITVATNMPAN